MTEEKTVYTVRPVFDWCAQCTLPADYDGNCIRCGNPCKPVEPETYTGILSQPDANQHFAARAAELATYKFGTGLTPMQELRQELQAAIAAKAQIEADITRLLELFRRQAIRSFIAGAGNTYFALRGKSLSRTELEFVSNSAEMRFPYVAESFRANDDIVSEYTAMVEKYGGAK